MVHVLCVNVRKTCAEALEQALAGIPHRQAFLQLRDEPRSRPPGSQPRLPTTTASLARYLEVEVPSWIPDDPLVLFARGSGIQRAAAWLALEEARELVSALVLLDDGPGADPASVTGGPHAGLIEFARDAAADPGEKLLLVASFGDLTGSDPPRSVVRQLRASVPPGAAAAEHEVAQRFLREYPASTPPGADESSEADSLPAPFLSLLAMELVPFLASLGPAMGAEERPR